MASSELQDDVKRYLEAKELMAALDKKVAKYRTRILEHMKMLRTQKIDDRAFSVTLREMRTEHIYRKDVPPEIWSRFSKTTAIEQVVVVDKTKPRARSPGAASSSSRN